MKQQVSKEPQLPQINAIKQQKEPNLQHIQTEKINIIRKNIVNEPNTIETNPISVTNNINLNENNNNNTTFENVNNSTYENINGIMNLTDNINNLSKKEAEKEKSGNLKEPSSESSSSSESYNSYSSSDSNDRQKLRRKHRHRSKSSHHSKHSKRHHHRHHHRH